MLRFGVGRGSLARIMRAACSGSAEPRGRVASGEMAGRSADTTQALVRRRSGRLLSRRNHPCTPQNQRGKANADPADEGTRLFAEAGRYRQTWLLWRPTAAGDAQRRASITSVPEHHAENSDLPLRKRERIMQRFRSPGSLQRFVSVFSAIQNLFVSVRSKFSAISVNLYRLAAMAH